VATAIGSNSCGTRESSEPRHHGNNNAVRSIWYRWVPDYTGDAVISTFGSSFDTILAAYRGSVLSALTQIASNDDAVGNVRWSRATFRVTNGVPHFIAVDGFNGAFGGVALNINPAGNDRFTNCVQISGARGSISTLNAGATNEVGEPIHGARSLWYCWTAPTDGAVWFHTHGSSVDTRLSVYHGSSITTLTPLASNDDAFGTRTSAVLFEVKAGAIYLLAASASDEGLVTLSWAPPVAPTITSIARTATNVYAMSISGETNGLYVIQFSPDLRTWADRGRVTNSTGVVHYDDSGVGQSGFYRALLAP
jgi:hypothetical protein